MNTKTLKNSTRLRSFSIALTTIEPLPTQPIQASSRDYGFDFDEDALARELLAPLDQPTLPSDTEELCALCFLS